MNIPKKDVVSFLLKERLQGKNARSQRELAEILNKRLKKNNPGFAITGARARIIALNTPGIKARIHTRKGRVPKKCPACRHVLKKTYTRNLKGRKLLLRLSCMKCSYRGSGGNWIPKRYEFWIR
jgi:predicted RNA-binding Zn-ribbon protein involved in translation (DUF1610 family)